MVAAEQLAIPPLLLIAWRRPHTLRRVLDAIRPVAPPLLFIACDGADPDREGEAQLVAATRALIEEAIDWPCRIERLYASANQGCRLGVSRAISWFFEHVEEGIILEDDCVPHPDFFRFCGELLRYYRSDSRVWSICGSNFQQGHQRGDASYYFSIHGDSWGWATWRRAWQHYPAAELSWPAFRDSGALCGLFEIPEERHYWRQLLDRLFVEHAIDTWDFQWWLASWMNNGLHAWPNTPLVSNIGFDEHGTHTFADCPEVIYADQRLTGLPSLEHPGVMLPCREADRYAFFHRRCVPPVAAAQPAEPWPVQPLQRPGDGDDGRPAWVPGARQPSLPPVQVPAPAGAPGAGPPSLRSATPPISVLMPCLNAGPFLAEAIDSVLADPAVLELLVADGGSQDGSLELLGRRAADDPRIRLVSQQDRGPADAINRAAQHARGTLIGWLNADDRYLPGAPSRALEALRAHPRWLMVYGEGEHIDPSGERIDRYPTRLPEVGLAGFRDYCFLCQPTVFWRRSLGLLLGPLNTELRTCFDFDYWIRAFQAFPDRIGHIPELQAQTRVHPGTISSSQLPRAVLEATLLQARQFPDSHPHMLRGYIEELRRGERSVPPGATPASHSRELSQLAEQLGFPAHQAQQIRELLLVLAGLTLPEPG